MQVRRDEGLAIHIGPEPCVGVCEGAGEASVGERIGQQLRHEMPMIPDADVVMVTEGDTSARVIASALKVRRGRRTWHVALVHGYRRGGILRGVGQMFTVAITGVCRGVQV